MLGIKILISCIIDFLQIRILLIRASRIEQLKIDVYKFFIKNISSRIIIIYFVKYFQANEILLFLRILQPFLSIKLLQNQLNLFFTKIYQFRIILVIYP